MADIIRATGDFSNGSMQMHEQMHQPLTHKCSNGQTSVVRTLEDGTTEVVRDVAVSRVQQMAAHLITRTQVKNQGGQKGTASEIRKRHRMACENAPPSARRPPLAPVNRPPGQLPLIPTPVCLIAPRVPSSSV